MDTFISAISKKEFPLFEKVSGKSIRKSIMNLIQIDYPKFTVNDSMSISELDVFREKYVTNYLNEQVEELTELENTVLNSLNNQSTLTDKLDGDDSIKLTLGQRVADKVADFGGSWTFIIGFGVFIGIWISINMYLLLNKGFDPYPFILLNLILSCIAAIQAPVIMMSQNRQEDKDRERAKKDYMINLKSEVEVRTLHEKVDHLLLKQHPEMLEMQKIQIEMMDDILKQLEQLREK